MWHQMWQDLPKVAAWSAPLCATEIWSRNGRMASWLWLVKMNSIGKSYDAASVDCGGMRTFISYLVWWMEGDAKNKTEVKWHEHVEGMHGVKLWWRVYVYE